jgi:hypothetical protein
MSKTMRVNKRMCATCPFRPNSPHAYLAGDLTLSALGRASRICHSTGENNAINAHTGKPERLCRGARDQQLHFFHGMGFLKEPTDAAWAAKCKQLGIEQDRRA